MSVCGLAYMSVTQMGTIYLENSIIQDKGLLHSAAVSNLGVCADGDIRSYLCCRIDVRCFINEAWLNNGRSTALMSRSRLCADSG